LDGIATQPGGDRAAWFTDSEGNVLALVQFNLRDQAEANK
jgi:predicted enzyme related to lactoylglutathione lyase